MQDIEYKKTTLPQVCFKCRAMGRSVVYFAPYAGICTRQLLSALRTNVNLKFVKLKLVYL